LNSLIKNNLADILAEIADKNRFSLIYWLKSLINDNFPLINASWREWDQVKGSNQPKNEQNGGQK
jgi:hypothetical protein